MFKFTLSLILCSLMLSQPASAKTFKVATLSPEGSSWMKIMRQAGDDIKAETEGRVKFRFYPGGVMGNDKAVLKKIRFGQLQGAALSGGALAAKAPNTQIYNLPRVFNSYEEVDYVRKTMDADIQAEFEKSGFINFGLAEGGFAYLMSKNVISEAEKLKDNKVWVPNDDPASNAASKAFDLSPTPLSLGDVLAGLQTDLIDTIFASPIAAIALQWHTQIEYITDLPLVYFYAVLAIDEKAFKKISSEDQILVHTIMSKAFKELDLKNRQENRAAFAALQQQGIKMVSLNKTQTAAWDQRISKAISDFIGIKGGVDAKTYNKTQALLTQYRQQSTVNQ